MHASAWPVGPRSDVDILNDAQVVVVAHIKSESIQNLPHSGGFETKVILVISRVLKGKVTTGELPIMIGYDAVPVPKHVITPNFGADGDHDFPYLAPYTYNYAEPIPLYENNADGPTPKINDDVRQNNIWFLRPYRSFDQTKSRRDLLGTLDFRDVQPLTKENQFRKMLK